MRGAAAAGGGAGWGGVGGGAPFSSLFLHYGANYKSYFARTGARSKFDAASGVLQRNNLTHDGSSIGVRRSLVNSPPRYDRTPSRQLALSSRAMHRCTRCNVPRAERTQKRLTYVCMRIYVYTYMVSFIVSYTYPFEVKYFKTSNVPWIRLY